ncbi:MAG: hypothetical protein J6X42_06195 [Alphaproteobacteria bacterium]|nr:hypothetical protein [Alphaproteobacteria bacterium]
MKQHFREHYGHKFYLNTTTLPTKAVNRFSPTILLIGLLCGLLFFAGGLALLLIDPVAGTTDLDAMAFSAVPKPYTLLSTTMFAYVLLILGGGLSLTTLFLDLRHKVISFDGDKISVRDHPFIGRSHSFEEKLSDYAGVRLRLKFCQYGLFNKNKFIIELYHKDQHKIVPLYISTNPKNVRHLWRQYALEFALPPIHISDKGMVSHNVYDMERPYVDVVKSWHLPHNFLTGKTHSQNFIAKQRQDKKMIKMPHFIYDFYSNLNVAVMLILTGLLAYALYSYPVMTTYLSSTIVWVFYALLLVLIGYAYINLVMRDVMLVHNQKIIIFRKILGISYQDTLIPFAKLKGIDISYTPTTDRYALNLLTDKNIVTVFNKLSPEDLRWIRGFLVREINQ